MAKNKYKISATNGCFDVLHLGHVTALKFAALQGDRLVVGINSDKSIKKLKGDARPINNQDARREFLLSFDFVDDVIIFEEDNALEFLKQVKPDVYVKSADYSLDSLNKDELNYLQSINSQIVFAPFLEGYSTTNILNKI